jgi:hypothetical protein
MPALQVLAPSESRQVPRQTAQQSSEARIVFHVEHCGGVGEGSIHFGHQRLEAGRFCSFLATFSMRCGGSAGNAWLEY